MSIEVVSQISDARRDYAPPHCPHTIPTDSKVEHLHPETVYNLMKRQECVLVDLRSEDRASGLIEGAISVPAIDQSRPFLSKVSELVKALEEQPLVVFTCQYSAHRAPQCSNWYRKAADARQRVAILSGGFRGWEALGLPVQALAAGDEAQSLDELAMRLGTQFVHRLPQRPLQVAPQMQLAQAQTQQLVQRQNGASVPPSPQPVQPADASSQKIQRGPARVGLQSIAQSRRQESVRQSNQGRPPIKPALNKPVLTASKPAVVSRPVSRPPLAAVAVANGAAAALRPTYVPPVLPNTVATLDGVEHLAPEVVQELLQSQQCVLIDLRGEDRAAGLIEGSVHVQAIDNVPFTWKVPELVKQYEDQGLVVFTCQYSAHRAPQCANWYREKASPSQRVAILTGGFRCWEGVGLPVQTLADAEIAKASDAVAMQLGLQFVTSLPERQAQNNTLSAAEPLSEPVQPSVQVINQEVDVPQVAQTPTPMPILPPMTLDEYNKSQLAPTLLNNYQAAQVLKDPVLSSDCESLDAATLHEHMESPDWANCLLVDLRGEDRAAGLIEGAVHCPAIDTIPFPVKVPNLVEEWADKSLVVFTCQYSRHRAPQCANWYKEQATKTQRVAVLEGGFRAWEAAGLPVQNEATGEIAQVANELALQLGTQFVHGIQAEIAQ